MRLFVLKGGKVMNNNIVKPEIKEAKEIATLIKEGWSSAYKGIISEDFLKNMDLEKMTEKWKKNIEVDKDVYIYKENNEILGVIRFGEAENSLSKKTGEIFCLYVKPEQKRKGIGTQLLNFAKDKLIKNGYEQMIIWCLKGNNQGKNFYKKCGGVKIKERDYTVRGIQVREEGFVYNLKEEEEITLIFPTIDYKEQAKEMMEEARKYDADNPDIWAGYSSMEKYETYEDWLQKLEKDLDFENIKPGRVPASTYFLLRKSDNKIVGIINIRFYLNDFLENYGGHIGYSVRATERRKGYGYKQLLLGLEKCLDIPINKVLITCRESNKGSAKIIEGCGGIYEDTRFYQAENDNFRRYWIEIK